MMDRILTLDYDDDKDEYVATFLCSGLVLQVERFDYHTQERAARAGRVLDAVRKFVDEDIAPREGDL